MTASVKSTLYCDFELRWYPWDDQHCLINLKVGMSFSLTLILACVSTTPRKPNGVENCVKQIYITVILFISTWFLFF